VKEILGGISKSSLDQAMQANWQCVKTILSEQEIGNFPDLWRTLSNKSPMMMLIKGKSANGE
jgi:hypothetical protein